MTDIRAAAERVRQVHANYRDGHPVPITSVYQPDPAEKPIANWPEDRNVLVSAWLAEHPADDDEPLGDDMEWLASIGCPYKNGEALFVAHHFTTRPEVHLSCVLEGDGIWNVSIGDTHGRPCKTRGDVRRLCQVLGIELNK